MPALVNDDRNGGISSVRMRLEGGHWMTATAPGYWQKSSSTLMRLINPHPVADHVADLRLIVRSAFIVSALVFIFLIVFYCIYLGLDPNADPSVWQKIAKETDPKFALSLIA